MRPNFFQAHRRREVVQTMMIFREVFRMILVWQCERTQSFLHEQITSCKNCIRSRRDGYVLSIISDRHNKSMLTAECSEHVRADCVILIVSVK